MLLVLLPGYALSFPAYDFTFFKTTDETLTSFNRNNVGIDITGYGFVGKEASSGIYLRIGIQTPLKTLIQMKDELLTDLFSSGDTSKTDTSLPGTDDTLPSPTTDNSVPVGRTDTPVGTENTDTSIISETTESRSEIYSAAEEKELNSTSTTEWRFLFSIGPAFRKIMTQSALVYAGLGVTLETQYVNIFTTSTGEIFSSFFARGSLDLDMGFRVGLEHSRTTIRIGVHSITNIAGFYSYEMYNTGNRGERKLYYDIYGYIAGKDGIMGATTGWGYIRLATTFTEKNTEKYNYSNRTTKVGCGVVEYTE